MPVQFKVCSELLVEAIVCPCGMGVSRNNPLTGSSGDPVRSRLWDPLFPAVRSFLGGRTSFFPLTSQEELEREGKRVCSSVRTRKN